MEALQLFTHVTALAVALILRRRAKSPLLTFLCALLSFTVLCIIALLARRVWLAYLESMGVPRLEVLTAARSLTNVIAWVNEIGIMLLWCYGLLLGAHSAKR